MDIENGDRQNAPVCDHCKEAGYQEVAIHRINAVTTLLARIIGFFSLIGVIHGTIIALSGFSGHYGAYPRLQLITHSILVGVGVIVVSLSIAIGSWRLLGKKWVNQCEGCGHVAQR